MSEELVNDRLFPIALGIRQELFLALGTFSKPKKLPEQIFSSSQLSRLLQKSIFSL